MKIKLIISIFIIFFSFTVSHRFLKTPIKSNTLKNHKKKSPSVGSVQIEKLFQKLPSLQKIQQSGQIGHLFAGHLKRVSLILTQLELKRKNHPHLKSTFLRLYIKCGQNHFFSKTIRYYCMSKWHELNKESFQLYLSSIDDTFKSEIYSSIHFNLD